MLCVSMVGIIVVFLHVNSETPNTYVRVTRLFVFVVISKADVNRVYGKIFRLLKKI